MSASRTSSAHAAGIRGHAGQTRGWDREGARIVEVGAKGDVAQFQATDGQSARLLVRFRIELDGAGVRPDDSFEREGVPSAVRM